ncbi:MAG: nucleoside phosphorylase [Fusobacteria bacterium]|nr:nucleoside phosphorylase [Fusobacteriota bacterium]
MNCDKQYLTHLTEELVAGAKYAVLPGDPKRAKDLAFMLDPNAKFLAFNRQHASYLANLEGVNVLVVSTGMGCPAISVTAIELHKLGVETYIRLGTSGTIKEKINLGDICITRAAVKLDGISREYVDEGYPAVAHFALTQAFVDGAKQEKIPHYVGITASSDTFWPGQERHDNYSGYLLRSLQGAITEWRALNVANFEMEASALLTIAKVLDVRAACFCGIIAKRTESEEPNHEGKEKAQMHWEKTLKAGLIIDMKRNGLIQ